MRKGEASAPRLLRGTGGIIAGPKIARPPGSSPARSVRRAPAAIRWPGTFGHTTAPAPCAPDGGRERRNVTDGNALIRRGDAALGSHAPARARRPSNVAAPAAGTRSVSPVATTRAIAQPASSARSAASDSSQRTTTGRAASAGNGPDPPGAPPGATRPARPLPMTSRSRGASRASDAERISPRATSSVHASASRSAVAPTIRRSCSAWMRNPRSSSSRPIRWRCADGKADLVRERQRGDAEQPLVLDEQRGDPAAAGPPRAPRPPRAPEQRASRYRARAPRARRCAHLRSFRARCLRRCRAGPRGASSRRNAASSFSRAATRPFTVCCGPPVVNSGSPAGTPVSSAIASSTCRTA